jgi:hypothetical protein
VRLFGTEITDDEWSTAAAQQYGQPSYAAIMARDAGEDTPENRLRTTSFACGNACTASPPCRLTAEADQRTVCCGAGLLGGRAFDPEFRQSTVDPQCSHFP